MSEFEQKHLWNLLHEKRKHQSAEIENKPNDFAINCLQFLPKNGQMIEFGAANGRDARYFAKKKGLCVYAIDFSEEAIKQLQEASKRDGTERKVLPIITTVTDQPFEEVEYFDAVYSRSALHITDEELESFMVYIKKILKPKGFLMIEGKTREDFKITRSEEVSPNLFKDVDGHLRRSWDMATVEEMCKKFGFELVSSGYSTEEIRGQETHFFNFIIQKI